MSLTLVIGTKRHSSWSLRPWLALKVAGEPFAEQHVTLYPVERRAEIFAHSPTGKVPALKTPDGLIWESLAILEWLAERHPSLLPQDRAARAHCRSAAAEMHAGFAALRNELSMDVGKQVPTPSLSEAAAKDVARVQALWHEARERFGKGGPFLYGAFSIADAMYAPVVTRFVTYSVPVDGPVRAYMDAVLALPAMREWIEAGKALSQDY